MNATNRQIRTGRFPLPFRRQRHTLWGKGLPFWLTDAPPLKTPLRDIVSALLRLLRILRQRLKLLGRYLRAVELGGSPGGEALQFDPELGAAAVDGAFGPEGASLPSLHGFRGGRRCCAAVAGGCAGALAGLAGISFGQAACEATDRTARHAWRAGAHPQRQRFGARRRPCAAVAGRQGVRLPLTRRVQPYSPAQLFGVSSAGTGGNRGRAGSAGAAAWAGDDCPRWCLRSRQPRDIMPRRKWLEGRFMAGRRLCHRFPTAARFDELT